MAAIASKGVGWVSELGVLRLILISQIELFLAGISCNLWGFV